MGTVHQERPHNNEEFVPLMQGMSRTLKVQPLSTVAVLAVTFQEKGALIGRRKEVVIFLRKPNKSSC